jgi:septal ring factor EnvC (AmiA/AmiB activator)
MRRRLASWGVSGLLCLLLPCGSPLAKTEDITLRQSQAEREQHDLRERIRALQKEIDSRESARKEAADALRASETAISVSNKKLRDLAAQLKQAQAELDDLHAQIRKQQQVLSTRREELAEQLRKQYASGLSPWTALLSGDDPQELGRDLGYLDYISRARAETVEGLRREIERLAELETRADARQRDIARLVRETTEQKAQLDQQKKERATVLARIEGQLAAQRAEAAKLGRDEKRLGELVNDLATQIAAARKAAEAARRAEEARRAAQAKAAAEARRAEEARKAEQARRAAEAARAAAVAAKQAEASAKLQAEQQARQAELQATQARQAAAEATREARAADAASKQAQAASTAAAAPTSGEGLKAGLRWPVRGTVMARFGTDRPEGGVWRGILVRANEGTPVHAVGGGTVVYANWLRGFGNLLIVDHGQQFLSVYAYNQSLLKQAGDPVRAGDTVALAGNTGGQLDSALYFEIRHRGAAVDPVTFLAR